eukprot:2197590-Alexandrium_andersonii.AAC.1
MSASLVGSEMCIRDRIPPFQVAHCLRTCGKNIATTPPAEVLSSPSPVSYTHLTLPTICSV